MATPDGEAVFVCGYSCGLGGKVGAGKLLPVRLTSVPNNCPFDLCWSSLCYVTDDGKIKYTGYIGHSPSGPLPLTTPTDGSVPSPEEKSKDIVQSSEENSPNEDKKSVTNLETSESINNIKNAEENLNHNQNIKQLLNIQIGEKGTRIISLTNDDQFSHVVSGWLLTVALTIEGQLFVWKNAQFDSPLYPDSSSGEIKVTAISLGELHSVVLTPDGKVYELIIDEFSYSLKPVMIPQSVSAISCGKEHVLLLTVQGTVYSYGLGSRGQLGHGSTDPEEEPRLIEALEGVSVKAIAAGGWHSAAVDEAGGMYLWGWNESGQLGLPCASLNKECKDKVITILCEPQLLDNFSNASVRKISLGSRHTAAVSEDGILWTWGWNGYGQLCHGNKQTYDMPTKVDVFVKSFQHAKDVRCHDWITIVWASVKQEQ